MRDPIEILAAVVTQASEAKTWSAMLIEARRVDESDTATLARVLAERRQIVALLRELGEPEEPFDNEYAYGAALGIRVRNQIDKLRAARRKYEP